MSGDEITIRNHAAFIWAVADLLRGEFKLSEYGEVILPLMLLRRLDCVLEPTKQKVLDQAAKYGSRGGTLEPSLLATSGEQFYNTSEYDFSKLLASPEDLADNLRQYIADFSSGAQDVIDKFGFDAQITRLDRSNLLYLVVSKFAEIDLHPDVVSNAEMSELNEELIRRFSELSNETAGEHFTPREVTRLMVNVLFVEDEDLLTKPGISRTILDPACGTGGMLSVAEDRLRELNPRARLHVYGQELNAQTYAICRSDMMLKGQDATNIVHGNSFSEDGHDGLSVDYAITNPPFGIEWKKVADRIRDEAKSKGFAGRFGAGLPRVNDGSFLFLQHMISKMKPVAQGGSRVAIVFNGSTLFTGAAGSGESEIRRWIIENDWLEAIIALPDQLFYNTGISTYLWVVTNCKRPERRGKVQLVDARSMFTKMRKSLGEKRKQISDEQIDEIVRLYGDFTESERVKVFPNESFRVPDVLPRRGGAEPPRATRSSPAFAISPWMFAPGVHPHSHVRLDQIATLRPDRQIASESDQLLTFRNLGSVRGASVPEGDDARPGESYSVCQAGDIVGSGTAWSVARDEHDGLLTKLEVIRLKDDASVGSDLLCEWLGSKNAAIQRVGLARAPLRPDLMVPVHLFDSDELDRAATQLRASREEARQLVNSLFDDPFASSSRSREGDPAILDLASRATALSKLIGSLRDVVQRAEWSYPYQVAELARHYRLQTTPDAQLNVGLRLAEALIREFGVLAAAATVLRLPERMSDVLAHFQGGISAGSWLKIVRAAQGDGVLDDLPDLRSMSFDKRGVGTLLDDAVSIRNKVAHSHGVMSEMEASGIAARVESILVQVLDESVWLSRIDHLYIRSCSYIGDNLGFEIRCDLLNGAHPVWETQKRSAAEPLAPLRVVADLPTTAKPLPLFPFATLAQCSDCRREEIYILDRVDRGHRCKARSLQNHQCEFNV